MIVLTPVFCSIATHTPLMVAVATSGLDAGPRQVIEEGKPLPPIEVVTQGTEWASEGGGGRLSHGGLLGLVSGGCVEPPSYPPRGTLSRDRS